MGWSRDITCDCHPCSSKVRFAFLASPPAWEVRLWPRHRPAHRPGSDKDLEMWSEMTIVSSSPLSTSLKKDSASLYYCVMNEQTISSPSELTNSGFDPQD